MVQDCHKLGFMKMAGMFIEFNSTLGANDSSHFTKACL